MMSGIVVAALERLRLLADEVHEQLALAGAHDRGRVRKPRVRAGADRLFEEFDLPLDEAFEPIEVGGGSQPERSHRAQLLAHCWNPSPQWLQEVLTTGNDEPALGSFPILERGHHCAKILERRRQASSCAVGFDQCPGAVVGLEIRQDEENQRSAERRHRGGAGDSWLHRSGTGGMARRSLS